ncbi:MAG: zf-HC2 domain-containing protein [Thermoleophilia bacterium]
MTAAVTPSGVRDGDPAALAGLCAVRGPSVLAYCRQIAGDAAAADAAAEAFASFRAAVVATDRLADLNPEALLVSATRKAAASRAEPAPLGICTVVPLLLAARADKTIAAADLELLERHLEGCQACRAPVARFDAAERDYRDPPDRLMDPAVIASMIAAMAAATRPAERRPPAPAANGNGDPPLAAEPAPVAPPPTAPEPPPATGLHPGGEPPPAPQPHPAVRGPEAQDGAAAEAADAAMPDGGAEFAPAAEPVIVDSGDQPTMQLDARAHEPAGAQRNGAVEKSPASRRAGARRAIGAHIPRPRRTATPPASARGATAGMLTAGSGRADRSRRNGRSRSRSRLPVPILLPVAVVLVAVLAALFVAGVLGGADPESSPRIAVPADAPAGSVPADVVVVPGAEEAGADDVESEKARERARARRKRQAAAAGDDDVSAAPATRTPAAATAPPPAAAVAPPPAPPPPPPASRRDAGTPKVDAGNGATGAEQIPPAQDTSTVPDLAPAPEPASAP